MSGHPLLMQHVVVRVTVGAGTITHLSPRALENSDVTVAFCCFAFAFHPLRRQLRSGPAE